MLQLLTNVDAMESYIVSYARATEEACPKAFEISGAYYLKRRRCRKKRA